MPEPSKYARNTRGRPFQPGNAGEPKRGIGVFVAINQFNFPAAMAMAKAVNELIGELAPR